MKMEVLTLDEAAKFFKVCKKTVNELSDVPFRWVGKQKRFNSELLEEYMKGNDGIDLTQKAERLQEITGDQFNNIVKMHINRVKGG